MDDSNQPAPNLAALYGELRTALLAFLRKHTGDAQVAEDLLHDVVVKALAAGGEQARVPKNLTGWLYAVARNAAVDYHRRRRPSEELPEDLAATADGEGETLLRELSHCLRPLAERLPPHYRDTLLAFEFDGQPLLAVAKAQGLSLSAVKTRASRGRRLLQQELVACCRVELSSSGTIIDYDSRAAAQCASTPDACTAAAQRGCH